MERNLLLILLIKISSLHRGFLINYIFLHKRYGPVGFGTATNKKEYEDVFINAIRSAFTEREIQLDILTCEGTYCGANGFLLGNNSGSFLGEEASNRQTKLR